MKQKTVRVCPDPAEIILRATRFTVRNVFRDKSITERDDITQDILVKLLRANVNDGKAFPGYILKSLQNLKVDREFRYRGIRTMRFIHRADESLPNRLIHTQVLEPLVDPYRPSPSRRARDLLLELWERFPTEVAFLIHYADKGGNYTSTERVQAHRYRRRIRQALPPTQAESTSGSYRRDV